VPAVRKEKWNHRTKRRSLRETVLIAVPDISTDRPVAPLLRDLQIDTTPDA